MFLKRLLFPKFCLGCGFIGVYICPNCQKNLKKIIKDKCFYCGLSSAYGLTHPACLKKDGVDGLISIYYYDNLLKKIIKSIKYRGVYLALNELIMTVDYEAIAKIKKLVDNQTIIQPIPLHFQKEKERGFNQVKPVADFLGRFLHLQVGDYIQRRRATLSQAQIKEKVDRIRNIAGAFGIKKAVAGRNFLLIDDVVTTGATIKEATRIIKRAGAGKVYVFTLAKGR